MALSCPRPRDDRDGPLPDLAAYYAPAQRASKLKRAVEEGAIAGRTAALISRWPQAEVRQNDARRSAQRTEKWAAVRVGRIRTGFSEQNSPGTLTASTQRWPHETRAGTPSRSSRLHAGGGLIRYLLFDVRSAVAQTRSIRNDHRQSPVIEIWKWERRCDLPAEARWQG
jgi:hypothetical protein